MVTLRENALKLEVAVSYQWAVDAQTAVVEAGKSTAQAIETWGMRMVNFFIGKVRALRSAAVATSTSARTFTHETPGKARDRLAAALLGMSVAQVRGLRQMILNRQEVVTTAGTKRKTGKRQALPMALDMPKDGMNVSASDLKDALSRVARAVNGRTSLPILGHVLLESENGCLKLSTTDLEIGISATIPAVIKKFARTTIPCKLAIDALKPAKGQVTLKNGADDTVILCINGAESKLLGLDPAEFPILPEVKHQELVWWRGFAQTVKDLTAVVGKDESRAILTGIMIDAENVAATDTHRLHLVPHGLDLSAVLPNGTEVIIPGRVCAEIGRALGCKDEAVTVGFSDCQAIFRFRDTVMVSRLIEGTFPNYRKVIPDPDVYTCEIVANKEALLNGLSQVAAVARENSERVLICGGANGKLALRASAGSSGDSQAVIDAEQDCRWPDGLMSAVSCKYLTDALHYINGDVVVMRSTGAVHQWRIEDGDGRLAVVMPMQVN